MDNIAGGYGMSPCQFMWLYFMCHLNSTLEPAKSGEQNEEGFGLNKVGLEKNFDFLDPG